MNRLDLAVRRYHQIVPRSVEHMEKMPLHELRVWLDEDVNAALEVYTRRPTFREHASWPIRALRLGADTEERELVDRIAEELVVCGKTLLKLAGHKLVVRKLADLNPPVRRIVGETVRVNGAHLKRIDARWVNIDELQVRLSQVRAIAKRGWTELVNVDDYFEPQQEWVKLRGGESIQRADWIVSLNPELLPVGNFVVRCLWKRITTRFDLLREFRQNCLTALRQIRANYVQDRKTLDSAWEKLSHMTKDLERSLRTGQENRLRDACVAAVQIYSAFHPDPDLSWLGLTEAAVEKGLQTLRARITGLQNAQIFDRIAGALEELQHVYLDESPNQSAIDEAIGRGGLVIDEIRRRAHWESKLIPIPEKGGSWKFLVALARQGLHKSVVGLNDVYGAKVVSESAMSTACGRFKKCLPASLSRLVLPGPDRCTYRLELDANRIHIFP